jgi:hypothetical protein
VGCRQILLQSIIGKRSKLTQYNPNPESEQREQIHIEGTDLADKVKELIHEGNVRRIIIRQDEHVIIEIPLTIGVVGTLIAPWLAAVGAIGALLAHCTIEIERSAQP